MQTYLFPSKFKKLGWILLIPFLTIFILLLSSNGGYEWEIPVFAFVEIPVFSESNEWFAVIKNNIIDEIVYIGLMVSLLFIAFSREKDEDEYITKLRANSLVWALLVNSVLLVFEIIFVYGIAFFYVLIINQFSILVLYIMKFNLTLCKIRRLAKNEK